MTDPVVGIRETLPVTTCVLCSGTGAIVLMRSWFTADGFKRVTCVICSGSGRSNYRPETSYVRAQENLRKLADATPKSHSRQENEDG